MAEKKIRRIGVLTSGGDASGMNPAVRAVTRAALASGAEVMGIFMGYKGLIDNELKLMNERDVSNLLNIGGTKLYSDRCDEFRYLEGQQKAADTCRKNNIDGIVAIGGDGTFRGARDLTKLGIPCIGIPATIDNDITSTDYSIGFDTSLNTVIDMVDRLRDTCESHARCNVVEIMGRGAGYLALYAGMAVGATAVILAEKPYNEDKLIEKMINSKKCGKRNFIILVSENMPKGFSEDLVKVIENRTGIETKFARLAHVQRGGVPTYRDRVIPTMMGKKAVELLYEGKSNIVVCYRNDIITYMDIDFALELDRMYKGKMTPEERAALSAEDIKKMEEICAVKRAHFDMMYDINETVSI
ncbi:MAG: 6-phosphofructokinase [Ruminococcaceae bacterium]|nr:6-phosphofructokinase [Oscillospiraceae bacterium]